jgi:hypothetical protein
VDGIIIGHNNQAVVHRGDALFHVGFVSAPAPSPTDANAKLKKKKPKAERAGAGDGGD